MSSIDHLANKQVYMCYNHHMMRIHLQLIHTSIQIRDYNSALFANIILSLLMSI